jgi:hypothetical protein
MEESCVVVTVEQGRRCVGVEFSEVCEVGSVGEVCVWGGGLCSTAGVKCGWLEHCP